MDLEAFVTEALAQTFRAVRAASQSAKENGGVINPVEYGKVERTHDNESRPIVDIEFDIAVSVESTAAGNGKLTVLGIGVEAGGSHKTCNVSRVRFKVPAVMPASDPKSPVPNLGSVATGGRRSSLPDNF
jgi:hypothetical protein